MNWSRIFTIYKQNLPFAVIPSYTFSSILGLSELYDREQIFSPQERMIKSFGIVSFGVIMGICYPITVPLLALKQIKN